jgi:hypothetical protein
MPESKHADPDETISITCGPRSHVDVPRRLLGDVLDGELSAEAFTTYILCRELVEQRTSMKTEILAKRRLVSLEVLEKHLEQLELLGWLDFSTGGILVNDKPFEKPRTGPTFLEKLMSAAEA